MNRDYEKESQANTHSREFQRQVNAQRKKVLDDIHEQMKKYLNRIPAEVVRENMAQTWSSRVYLKFGLT